MNLNSDIPPLVRIKLLGDLGRRFTRVIELRGWSTWELVRGVAANFPGFREHLFQLEEKGFRYRVYRNLSPIMELDELGDPVAAEEVIIAPIPCGAGGLFRGVGAILAGAAILGIGILTGGTAIALAGGALIAGGFADLFSKSQKTPPTETERSQSFLFDFSGGSRNSRLAVVPAAYGRKMRQLSEEYAISRLITTTDIPIS